MARRQTRNSFRAIGGLSLATVLLAGCAGAGPVVLQPPPVKAGANTSGAIQAPPAATAAPANSGVSPAILGQLGVLDSPQDRLYVRNVENDSLSIIDVPDGTRERRLPLGTPSSGWSVLYTSLAALGKTTVMALNPATGQVLRQTEFDGEYRLPPDGAGLPGGLSPDGHWLALEGLGNASVQHPGQYDRTAHSRFAILDTAFKQPPILVDLNGDFAFDALSNAGTSLYVTENLSYDSPPRYQVRQYSLGARSLDPNPVAVKSQDVIMAGTRHAAVTSRDGEWSLSLYLNDKTGPFIHALNLNDHYALCLDLPTYGKGDPNAAFWALAASPDGTTIYAVNGALGLVAEVSTGIDEPPQIQRTQKLDLSQASLPSLFTSSLEAIGTWLAPVAEAKSPLSGSAMVSPDGKTLYVSGGAEVLAIDTSGLTLRKRYLSRMDDPISGLALSRDGSKMYVVNAARSQIVQVDLASGQATPVVEAPGGDPPWTIEWIAPSP